MKLMHRQPVRSTSPESRHRIYSFLKQHSVGTLATVTPNNEPHAAVIYYWIDDEFNVVFTTKRETRKFDNLTYHKHAVLVVYDTVSQTTVQFMGVAEEITDEDESQAAFHKMLEASMETSEAGLPPLSKLSAGAYVAVKLRPTQIRMAIFARPDPGGYDMYESIEFEPLR